jgi:hypothetical protein
MSTFGTITSVLEGLNYGYMKKSGSDFPIIYNPAGEEILKRAEEEIYCLRLIDLNSPKERPDLSLRTGNLQPSFLDHNVSDVKSLPFGFGGAALTTYGQEIDLTKLKENNPVLYKQIEMITNLAWENNKFNIGISSGHGAFMPESGKLVASLQNDQIDIIKFGRAMKSIIEAQTNFNSLIDFLASKGLKEAGILKEN